MLDIYNMMPMRFPAVPVDASDKGLGPYTLETTQRFGLSRQFIGPLGELYRYVKSGGVWRTGRGAKFLNAIPATGIDYSALARAQSIGDKKVLMTNQGVVAQTLDGLAGGIIIISDEDDDTPTDGRLQRRRIVHNTAAGVSDTCEIELDFPLHRAVTTSTYAFCMPNPWNNIGYDGGNALSVAGVPAVYCSASGYYGFIQTNGLLWLAPQSTCGTTAHARQLVFRHDGSIDTHDYSDSNAGQQQHAGFIVDDNSLGNGSTIIMLEVE
jgi:hypothetical protein